MMKGARAAVTLTRTETERRTRRVRENEDQTTRPPARNRKNKMNTESISNIQSQVTNLQK